MATIKHLDMAAIIEKAGTTIFAPDAINVVQTDAGVELEFRVSGIYTLAEMGEVVTEVRRIKQVVVDALAAQERRKVSLASVETELASLGFRMNPALDSIAGGADCLLDLATDESVDPPNEHVARLAAEWTILSQGHAQGMLLTPAEYGYLVGRGHGLLLAGADVICQKPTPHYPITNGDLAAIVSQLLTHPFSGELDTQEAFSGFCSDLTALLCDYCGGDVVSPARKNEANTGLDWSRQFVMTLAVNDSSPGKGGIWCDKPASVPLSDEASAICARLLDSEAHAEESAVPAVAEDAAALIHKLSAALMATQVALSQAMQAAQNSRNSSVESA